MVHRIKENDSFYFEVRQFVRGKWKTISSFKDLRNAEDFAYHRNNLTRETTIIVRVDVETLGLFNMFPEDAKSLNSHIKSFYNARK